MTLGSATSCRIGPSVDAPPRDDEESLEIPPTSPNGVLQAQPSLDLCIFCVLDLEMTGLWKSLLEDAHLWYACDDKFLVEIPP